LFDFLIDIVPRDEVKSSKKNSNLGTGLPLMEQQVTQDDLFLQQCLQQPTSQGEHLLVPRGGVPSSHYQTNSNDPFPYVSMDESPETEDESDEEDV